MSVHLIGKDILLMRKRYDEALQMQGIPCKYQYPNMATTNAQGESVVDSYSEEVETHIFFDGTPKAKTYKRYGWVVENDQNLPFLLHCSFGLPSLQKDSIFTFSGLYDEMPARKFRVVELTYSISCPDHMICQIVPCYEKQTVGRTDTEIKNTFNKSNYFIKQPVDYRGDYMTAKEGDVQ